MRLHVLAARQCCLINVPLHAACCQNAASAAAAASAVSVAAYSKFPEDGKPEMTEI